MRRRFVAGLLLALLAVGCAPATAVAAEDAPAPVRRVLILSVPYLTWSDLGSGDAPNLDRLLDESAIANLAVRAARRLTTPGEGYATIGAGTRAGAPREQDGLALAPGEPFEGGSAAEAYRRRTGVPLGDAAAGSLGVAGFERVNDELLFGGEVGALGAALSSAGVGSAVVANADLSRTSIDPARYGRQAVAALMTPDGRLERGRVDRGLLVEDGDAPYGHRLDPAAVVAAFDGAWQDDPAVVLVEMSDLVRAERYAPMVTAGQRDELRRVALGWTDTIVAGLLSRVDPARDAVLVVAPSSPTSEARLTVAALYVPGGPGALLRSASTRRSGFVTLADVGATVLDLLGVERPASMEGRPMGAGRQGGTPADRRRFLIEEEREARFRDRLVAPVATAFVAAQVLLSALAVIVLVARRARARSAVEIAALGLLAFLPLTYLAGLLPFARLGVPAYVAFVVGGALGVAVLVRFAAPRRSRVAAGGRDLWPVGILLGVILVVIAGSAVFGSRLQLSTVFGDSPIVAGRFTGINNLTFAQLTTAAVLIAAFLTHQLPGRRGAAAGVALLVAVLVIDGLPAWGADVGGVLAAVPAFLLVGSLMLGLRVGPRTIVLGAIGTAAAIGAFAAVDLLRPSSRRSHLGRLVEQIDSGGWDAFLQVVERKLYANVSVLNRSPWALMVPAALAFVAYLVYRSPSALGQIQRRMPELRIALAGILVAAILGFALNDSGIAVPGMMLGVLNPVLVYLAARWT